MANPYLPQPGPSRYHNNQTDYPPVVPSKSPNLESQPWTNGTNAPDGLDRDASRGEGSRRNPLVDLIDSERLYVEQLGLVIRRVAAAWSRKDFPPPKLDAMFRSVESVYRANRAFGTKLKEIGPNPSSPKALGDLLMRWIDDLETPYHKYASTFMTGFDTYPPVSQNQLLPQILSDISTSSPPTPPLAAWSLDALFILPYARLRYYRKLYARLLRSTKEGRSDHRLLVVANQRLEALVSEAEGRLEVDVAEEDEVASLSGNGAGNGNGNGGSSGERSRETSWKVNERISRTSSALDSSQDSHSNFSPFNSRIEDPRNSGGSAATSYNQSPQRRPTINVPTMTATPAVVTPTTATAPISDLELRIDPERTLDLFTMQPKKCKLQMNPSSLPFVRSLRSSHDAVIYFTPNSTGSQVIHRRAHFFILSDLFLVAEWMEAMDKAYKAKEHIDRVGSGGAMPEMWLAYPPLAGKHLAVAEGTQANVLIVTIMRKETFIIHAESEVAKDQIMKDLLECIDFATTASRRNTAVPSPVFNDARSPSSISDSRSHEGTFPPLRYPSPFSAESSPSASPRPSETPPMPPPPMAGNALISQMKKMTFEPGDTVNWGSLQPQLQPQQPPVPAVLPPRGASLRSRVPSHPPVSNNSLSPPHPTLPHASASDSALPPNAHHHPGAPIPRSPSARSVQSAPRPINTNIPPVPSFLPPGTHLSDPSHTLHLPPSRSRSAEPLRPPEPPSARFSSFPHHSTPPPHSNPDDISPPMSPLQEEEEALTTLTGPAIISAQMKCKVFLNQSHQQWKSLGNGKLKLYAQKAGGNVKQLVVEKDGGGIGGGKGMLISTIVLTDGVERVAKTGVAVEISDKGKRTGIVYMIQLRNENSAAGLFESLLAGSDRAVGR